MGQFIVQAVLGYGGRPKQTNALPPIQVAWKAQVTSGADYLGDEEELRIEVAGDRFGEMESFLLQAFGKPSQPTQRTTKGMRQGTYGKADMGVALQFYGDDKKLEVVLYGKPKGNR